MRAHLLHIIKNYKETVMKRIMAMGVVITATLLLICSSALALTVLPGGDYSTPDDWRVVASLQPANGITLDHFSYYMWGIRDLPFTPTEASIVFHNITNWAPERTWLSVYLFDLGYTGFWSAGKDSENTTLPDGYPWLPVNLVDGTWVNDWQNGDVFDVVFTTSNPILLAYLSNV